MYFYILFVLITSLIIFIFVRPEVIRKTPRLKVGVSFVISLAGLVYAYVHISKNQAVTLFLLGLFALAAYDQAFKEVKKK
jgi:hypothetical protein